MCLEMKNLMFLSLLLFLWLWFYRFLIITPFPIVYYSCIDGFEIVNKIDFENAIPKIPQKSIGFNCQMNGEYDKSM